MQNNMDGIFNKIFVVLLMVLIISCKKEDKTDAIKNNLIAEGKVLINQNSNILIDSLERYDMNILYPEGKLKPLEVALLDSVGINERFSRETFKCITFKLEQSDFLNFKSPYKLNLVKKEVGKVHVLFISFLNLEIQNDLANVVVRKIYGISSTTDRYYFKKQNNKWILIDKHQMSMG